MSHNDTLARILALAPVIPVMIIEDIEDAVPLARALIAGGLTVLEVTLRTAVGLDAIRRISDACPQATVGAGTVLTPAQLEATHAAGAQFAVSPGATRRLLDAAIAGPIPLLPGVATATEAMTVIEVGLTYAKLFPAEAAGGLAMLKSLYSPLPQLVFCPTGGISEETAPHYLALANVVCVGGSWMLPRAAINAGHWDVITALAARAATLR